MDDFGCSATHMGSEREFRWFVPRILELLADHPQMVVDAERIASGLRLAGVDVWPDDEREVVRDVFVALGGCGSGVAGRGDGQGGVACGRGWSPRTS